MQNNAAVAATSSKKDRANEKTYRIPISNGIFAHYPRLRDARWLLDLFVDWTTREIPNPDGSRDGLVLGGKPIRDEDTASPFGCSDRTTRRWRQRLARYGYISQKRTPVGYVIRVMKSKKWALLKPDAQAVSGQKWPVRTDKNVRSELPSVAGQSGHDRQFRTTDRVRSNKDSAVQDSDGAVEAAASAAADLLKRRTEDEWKNIGLAPVGSPVFQKAWEEIYVESFEDEKISDVMERCILACKQSGISIPKPFYDAKRRVEGREGNAPEQDPIFKFAKGVRPPAVQM